MRAAFFLSPPPRGESPQRHVLLECVRQKNVLPKACCRQDICLLPTRHSYVDNKASSLSPTGHLLVANTPTAYNGGTATLCATACFICLSRRFPCVGGRRGTLLATYECLAKNRLPPLLGAGVRHVAGTRRSMPKWGPLALPFWENFWETFGKLLGKGEKKFFLWTDIL